MTTFSTLRAWGEDQLNTTLDLVSEVAYNVYEVRCANTGRIWYVAQHGRKNPCKQLASNIMAVYLTRAKAGQRIQIMDKDAYLPKELKAA